MKLIGTLSLKQGFGPPGFGESPERDVKFTYVRLTLDRPICVDGYDESGEGGKVTGVKHLQMAYDTDPYPYNSKWLKGHVVVTGKLRAYHCGWDQEGILIKVSKIERFPRRKARH